MNKLLNMPIEWYVGFIWITLALLADTGSIECSVAVIGASVMWGVASIRMDLRKEKDE